MQLVRDFFLDLGTGRLTRARFALLFVVTLALALLMLLALGAGIGLTERFLPGLAQLLKDRGEAARAGGVLVALLLAAGALAIIWAQVNLVAKRARDIGWHPVLVAVIYLVAVAVSGLGLLVALALALVPGRAAT